MTFQRVEIENLRCLKQVSWEMGPGLNLVVGANGAGKTSLLEAISLIATGRTLRAGGVSGAQNKDGAFIRVTGEYGSGLGHVRVGYERSRKNRAWILNGESQRSAVAFLSRMPLMVMSPETHYQALQNPDVRRATTHWTLFHVEPLFLETWRRYQRVLRQRNAALRQRGGIYRMFDQGLAQLGETLLGYWNALYADLGARVGYYARQLGLEDPVTIEIRSPWVAGELEGVLRTHTATDERLGYTQVGAHRLDLRWFLRGEPLQTVGSHGQQKVVISAWRLALTESLSRVAKTPTLLIDDLPAELDRARREAFFALLATSGGQAVATTTDLPDSTPVEAQVFHVEHGVLRTI